MSESPPQKDKTMASTQQHPDGYESPPGGEVVESTTQHVTGLKLSLVVASVTLVAFLMLLDMSIIVTAIPKITSDFHSLRDVGWYGSAYPLANCALQPLAGKIYTKSVLKYTFLAFLCIFEIGSALCGAAQSSTILVVGRAVAGLGGSGLTNGAMTILSVVAPKSRQPLLIGIMMGLSQIAIVCGPLIGGALTEHASWRWCFYINLPIGAVAAVLLLAIHIPDRLPSAANKNRTDQPKTTIISTIASLDPIGFLIFTAFAVPVTLALESGGSEYAWRSSVIIGLFCGGGVALIVFALWERHVGNDVAMIPASVAGIRQVWSSCFFIGLFGGSLLMFSYYVPIYFQAVKGVSPTLSGVYMLPGILGQILMAVASGIIIGKTGYYLPWTIASSMIVSVAAGLVSTFQPDTSTAKWIVYQLIGGLGRGCGMQTPVIAVQNVLPLEQSSLGISLVVFGQTFGGAVFLSIASQIFSNGLLDGLSSYAPAVDAQAVVAAGASSFRQVVASESLAGVLRAYCLGIDHVFYLTVGASVSTLVFAMGMGWRKMGSSKSAEQAVSKA